MAMAVPVPSDDDDDETQDPNLNNLKIPDIVAESHSLATDLDVTDYPLTQLTPERNLNYPSHSQPRLALRCFSRKKTGPQLVFGTHRLTKPSSRGASDL